MNDNRKIAVKTGILFLIPLLTYGIGNGLITGILDKTDYLSRISADSTPFITGAILMIVNSITVVLIPIVLFPLLKPLNAKVAVAYLVSRILEAVILLFGVMSLLSLRTISAQYLEAGSPDASQFAIQSQLAISDNFFSFQVAMILLGLGSLLFCVLLYQFRLVPRFVAGWGFTGYALLLAGSVAELCGVPVGVLLSLPGGLFELFLAGWLVFKGFRSGSVSC